MHDYSTNPPGVGIIVIGHYHEWMFESNPKGLRIGSLDRYGRFNTMDNDTGFSDWNSTIDKWCDFDIWIWDYLHTLEVTDY